MPKLPPKALLAVALALGCTVAPVPARTATTFVIPTDLPNGRVEITIAPAYARGLTLTIPIAIVATRGSITLLSAKIMASGINEGGAPAEVLVRELTTSPLMVTAGGRRSTVVSWNTLDAKGVIVPPDAYSLVLEVRSDDGTTSRTLTAGATLELR